MKRRVRASRVPAGCAAVGSDECIAVSLAAQDMLQCIGHLGHVTLAGFGREQLPFGTGHCLAMLEWPPAVIRHAAILFSSRDDIGSRVRVNAAG